MALDLGRIEKELGSEELFRELIFFDEAGSTMDLLRLRAEAGAPEGTAVLAGRQTSGRGRRGRSWESPEGGLWFSLLLRPAIEPRLAGCISVSIALSSAQALRERYRLPVLVKWPNDLILEGRKLGGILIELATRGERIDWLIVGLGLNVNNPLPEGARIPPISLSEALGGPVELEGVFVVVFRGIARGYLGFLREGFGPVRARWAQLSALEDGIWVERYGERFRAEVKGLSEEGKLIVERGGRLEELAAEEVTVEQ